MCYFLLFSRQILQDNLTFLGQTNFSVAGFVFFCRTFGWLATVAAVRVEGLAYS